MFSTFTAPANVLVGNATLINVANGTAFDAAPTAIQNFQDSETILFQPGDLFPNLGDGEVAPTAYPMIDGAPVADCDGDRSCCCAFGRCNHGAADGQQRDQRVRNRFGADTSSTKTDWVVTFPTKHHYTDQPLTSALPPFHQLFPTTGTSCDPIALSIYDREEKTQVSVGQTQFSPRPTGPAGASLCNEVNVLTFNNSAVLGSGVQLSVDTSTVGTAGWANLGLTGALPTTGSRVCRPSASPRSRVTTLLKPATTATTVRACLTPASSSRCAVRYGMNPGVA